TILIVVGVLGYIGLVLRGDRAAALGALGTVWYRLSGWGAYSLLALLVAGGAVLVAESLVRRPLLRQHLFLVALLLWIAMEGGSTLFLGHHTGGLAGKFFASSLGGLPPLVARVVAVALAGALALALAEIGPSEAARGVGWAVRQAGARAPSLIRSAATARHMLTRAPAKGATWPRGDTAPAEPHAEFPATVLLPTAGFPRLEAGTLSWELPPLDLFDVPRPPAPVAPVWAEEMAQRLEGALYAMGIAAEVRRDDIWAGPMAIRLSIRPAERLRRDARGQVLGEQGRQSLAVWMPVSQILRARPQLAAALGVRRLRMEAPSPGQPFIHVEVPRPDAQPVTLSELLLSDAFQQAVARSRLALALGRDVRGQARALDLARCPHLLLSGEQGTGAGATARALLTSLLSHATPDDVRLVLINPRGAEAQTYDDLPHLLMPIVTEPGATLSALRRAIEEAERRSQLFTRLGVPGLEAYQQLAGQETGLEWLPRIVVVVAELADLLPGVPGAEQALCRLAHLGRTTGLHLILATERPSDGTLSGPLKAHLPTRLAFAVGSAAISRTILGATGAECLLGRGDALLLAGEMGQLERVRGTEVSAAESVRLARFWRRQAVSPTATPAATPAAPPAYTPPLVRHPHPTPPMGVAAFGPADAPPADAPPADAPPHAPRGEAPPSLPPLPRRTAPPSGGAASGRALPAAPPTTWQELLSEGIPAGWTDEMIEGMMRQIRAVLANGRVPHTPPSPGGASDDEEE
ncbi:MAG: DNA translocase FtsK, partial [Ktedonobacterales bacterium]|nr:DNA translocase FtsK [Ktedonobacterales bacterium]